MAANTREIIKTGENMDRGCSFGLMGRSMKDSSKEGQSLDME